MLEHLVCAEQVMGDFPKVRLDRAGRHECLYQVLVASPNGQRSALAGIYQDIIRLPFWHRVIRFRLRQRIVRVGLLDVHLRVDRHRLA